MCLIVSTWLAGEACAVPACPAPVTVAQPDGRKIEIRLKGDEFLHWHEDAAGFTILKDPKTRRWMYAARAAHGGLVPGSLVVGKDDPTVSGEPRHMLPDGAVARASADARDRDEQSAVADGPSVAAASAIKNLVVLVEFADLAGTHTKAEFEALFNTVGYNTDGAKGSVKDYYNEVSYNSIDVDSVVTDWITLDRKYSFYGRNDVSGDDARPREMVQEALAKLEASGFDFSALDADNDGWVDGLTIMHSGRGEEYAGNDPNYIWSHKWQMISTVTYDGKKMLEYHTEPEIRGWDDTPSTWGICRIGVICHETGHFLGLPDLYDYDYDSKGVGDFCLMAGGSWNGSYGTLPAHMSAWCKKELGWVTPTVVSSNGTYTVPRVEDNPAVFRLGGPFPSSQYFLVENRQGYGFDVGMPGITRGLLIWHIDETRPDNDDHTHYLVDLEEAGGTQHLELDQNDGDDSDYYRAGHNTSFTADTTPNNLSYSGTPLGLNIVSVSASGSSMTFTVGAPPQPLDHFDWAAVASPQAVDAPFAVTVTAKDSAGAIATGFTGSVALSGDVGTVGEVTIGGATSTWEQPMSTLFEDARTQVIYLAEEVGGPCAIEALSLYVTETPGQTMKNWTIRMKHTALSDYPTTPSWEASGWATVYQNDETVSSTGWVTFTFAAPFDYDGAQNLMIDFSYNNSTWSDNGLCRYSTTGQYRSIYYETDSSYGDPLTWSGTGSPAPDRSVNFPNIKLGLSGNQVAISPTVSGNFAGGVWTGQVMVLEEAAGMYLRTIDGSGSAGSSNTFDVQQLEQTHTLTVQTWPITGVSITGDKPGTTDYTAPCDDQKVVNLTAPATVTVGALRYDFERWYGGSPAGQNVQVTMDGDKTLVAEYIMRRHALTVQSSPVTGISIAGDKPATTDYTVLC
ncbi:MAG: M6 family metalloprotease domain-containing protein, partial [Planctomycetes bacterium]|nr:M6 family metalloprotease domain-containing protein [Planctomycetota bacterium]